MTKFQQLERIVFFACLVLLSIQTVASFTPNELWAIRAASAATTYFGFVSVADRPKGKLLIDPQSLQVKTSSVPGAGLGVYAATTIRKEVKVRVS
jgi:cytochrome c biogenesis protein CcdA